jgi:cell division protein FtsB
MADELESLCAERQALFAETERLENGDPDALKATRAKLAQILHEINRLTGNPE